MAGKRIAHYEVTAKLGEGVVGEVYEVEDTQLNVPAPGVLVNDNDPDGDNISIDSYTQPAKGMVTLNADGSFTYTPDENEFGEDTFTYTLCDDGTPQECSTAAMVTITVAAGADCKAFLRMLADPRSIRKIFP